MSKLTVDNKIDLIKKYYKKSNNYLNLSLLNYEGYNIYITLDYLKKSDSYRLSWYDLDLIEDKDIEKYLSCAYINKKIIESINEDFSNFVVESNYKEELLNDNDIVYLNANIKTKVDDHIEVTFKKYLPKKLAHLFNLIVFIFRNMPKNFENLLFELVAQLTDSTERYEYKKEFDFDLLNGDIDKLFGYQIIQRGKKYHEEGKVKFLEKIDDRYFAIVEGNEKYLTIIKYNEEEKKMQVYCSCPCEFYCKHMYAVIMAIRNNEFNRFYKISYKNPDKNILERILEFDYLLCMGIVEQNFEILNGYGEIELVPILDKNDRFNWQILEDSEDEILTKEVKYFLDNK